MSPWHMVTRCTDLLSACQADYYREGLVVSKRMDILIGRRAVHRGSGACPSLETALTLASAACGCFTYAESGIGGICSIYPCVAMQNDISIEGCMFTSLPICTCCAVPAFAPAQANGCAYRHAAVYVGQSRHKQRCIPITLQHALHPLLQSYLCCPAASQLLQNSQLVSHHMHCCSLKASDAWLHKTMHQALMQCCSQASMPCAADACMTHHAAICNAGNAVSMTLGLPALTLRRMGITRAITDDYVLPIKISGVSHAPEVDLAR